MSNVASDNGLSGHTIRAADFLGTLGVNTHIAYTDGGYANLTNVTADLAYLGVKNVRDGISNGAYGSAPLSSYIALAKSGVKFTFLIAAGGTLTTSGIQAQLSLIDQVNEAVPGSVVAVEGTNEINNAPITFNGVGGLQGAINLQRYLYATVHADPHLPNVAVDYFTGYGAGGIGAGPDPATTSGVADFDTQHPYPNNGNAPASWITPKQALGNENSSTGYGPAVYTETGYSTNGGTSGAVNTDVQAKYTLDLLLDAATDNISRTYLYQLMDAYQPGSRQGDDGYGLFNPNNTPKPAATAIRNLVSLLTDTGTAAASFKPSSLGYSVTGLPSTGNSLAFEKSNGTYDIAVWNEPQIWNEARGSEITSPVTNVTVGLGRTYATIEVFDPLSGTAPISTLHNVSSVKLGLTDHPLIVEIEPAAANAISATRGTATMVSSSTVQETGAGSAASAAALNNIYESALGRSIDAGGLAAWQAVLAQSGQSLTTVQAAIAGSPEAAADLNGIYENALGRPVDPGGLAAWQAVLAQSGQSLATVQAAIAGSPEAAADLTTVYQDVLGRAADAGGLAGWQAILAQPGQSLATVRADIAESPESQGNLQFLYQAFTGQSPSTADINSATLQLNTTTLGAQFLNLYEQDYGGAIQTATPNTPLAVQPGHDLIGINFSGSNGLYTVSGFNPALDFVQINDAATAAPTAVSQVYNSANGVRIDFSNSSELLLQGVTSSQIHVSNFLIS